MAVFFLDLGGYKGVRICGPALMRWCVCSLPGEHTAPVCMYPSTDADHVQRFMGTLDPTGTVGAAKASCLMDGWMREAGLESGYRLGARFPSQGQTCFAVAPTP